MSNRDPFLHATFEALHAMPEGGFQEEKTSAYLAEALEKLGYQVTRNIGTTGVLGVIDSGKPGPRFCLRADMDALPFDVDGKPCHIHACGHDAHSAMVLTAAKRWAEKGIPCGKLYILFQQAEETTGAPQMIETELLSDIEEMVGIHLRPIAEAKLGEATPALYHSAACFTTFEITGRTAHGARPHQGINAIDVAADIIIGINAIRENPVVGHSIKTTRINTVGGGENSIPDFVRVTTDMRAATNEVADSIKGKVEQILAGSAQKYGAKVETTSLRELFAAEYDPDTVALATRAIEAVGLKVIPEIHTVGGEDFHHYRRMMGIPTAYIGLGADLTPGLHSPDMQFNHDCMDLGAAILEKVVELKYQG